MGRYCNSPESGHMKVVIPGGSGQVGTILARAFQNDGHDVVVLSRKPATALCRVVQWDAVKLGDWVKEFEGADAVINLAGRSVNCRYTEKNRRLIKDSRVHSTRVVGEAIQRAARPPRVWLQASTATIYAHRYDAPNDEVNGIIGGKEPDAPDTWRFSIDVAIAWERAANEAITPRTRKVIMRSAMTLSPDPRGVFDVLLGLVRWGLGGKAGDGQQYISWVHDQDFMRAVYRLIKDESMVGPVNVASPEPLPNAEFMSELRRAWCIGFGLPAAKWMLEIGAIFLRTETELILKSRRVYPRRLLEAGMKFEFPTWPEAAADLCRRWREVKQSSEPRAK